MELNWLEDFILLAQIKNFGKTAELRNVSQPAFSRRIKALEMWLGAPLIDRSCFPTELTLAGVYFYDQAVVIMETISEARLSLKDGSSIYDLTIDFSIPHNLSFTFFPVWIKHASKLLGSTAFRLKALNVHDAVMALANGGVDLLIAYSHPSIPLKLNPNLYEFKALGLEKIALYGLANIYGGSVKDVAEEFPFLSYSGNAYLGKVADYILARANQHVNLKKVYETDMAEGLKSMMLAGHGLAFLPESSIRRELSEGLVVEMFLSEAFHFNAELEIKIFRAKLDLPSPNTSTSKKASILKRKVLDNLWDNLSCNQS